jgi:hypothetical protein
MAEPPELTSVVPAESLTASEVRHVTVRQGVVGSTIIVGHDNVVNQTVTIIRQHSRAELESEHRIC